MNVNLLSDFLNFDLYPLNDNLDDAHTIYNNDARQTLIVIRNTDEQHLEFLSKILSAIKYDMTKDVVLIAVNPDAAIHLIQLTKTYDVFNILLFGIKPKDVGLYGQIPNYYPISINEKQILVADALAQIAANQSKKKDLWTALQRMFV